MAWTVHQHLEVREWRSGLAGTEAAIHVTAAIDLLAAEGPALGRPVVGKINGSRHANMKEIRAGTVRILFVFDPERQAVLLVGGDKRGQWERWHKKSIPLADDRYDEWLKRT